MVRRHPDGATVLQIAGALEAPPPRRPLQYRLPAIAEAVGTAAGRAEARAEGETVLPLSKLGSEIQVYVRKPPEARKPVGYDRTFLDAYRPHESFYLTAAERAHLREVGTPTIAAQPADTYAKQLLNRLIDLSWNSSRLEGNTYSLLDTSRLMGAPDRSRRGDRDQTSSVDGRLVQLKRPSLSSMKNGHDFDDVGPHPVGDNIGNIRKDILAGTLDTSDASHGRLTR